jgi:hypothetical protein
MMTVVRERERGNRNHRLTWGDIFTIEKHTLPLQLPDEKSGIDKKKIV